MCIKRCEICDARMDFGEGIYQYEEVCRNCGQMHCDIEGHMVVILTDEQKEIIYQHNVKDKVNND